MNTATSKNHISSRKAVSPSGEVRVFKSAKAPKKFIRARFVIPKISAKTRHTFEMISDPKNAHLFTVDAALKAFAHIKV